MGGQAFDPERVAEMRVPIGEPANTPGFDSSRARMFAFSPPGTPDSALLSGWEARPKTKFKKPDRCQGTSHDNPNQRRNAPVCPSFCELFRLGLGPVPADG